MTCIEKPFRRYQEGGFNVKEFDFFDINTTPFSYPALSSGARVERQYFDIFQIMKALKDIIGSIPVTEYECRYAQTHVTFRNMLNSVLYNLPKSLLLLDLLLNT